MLRRIWNIGLPVNCRIGSLEILFLGIQLQMIVNCRIGSLEINNTDPSKSAYVNCRIGSLEICDRLAVLDDFR